MGVALYRKGNTHTIKGIECEMQVFPTVQLQELLKDGWYVNPLSAYGRDTDSINSRVEILSDLIERGLRNIHSLKSLEKHLETLHNIKIREDVYYERLKEAEQMVLNGISDTKKAIERMQPVTTTEPEPEVENYLDGLSADEIRQLSKKSGIKSWHLKSIETLKKEISDENRGS